MSQEKRTQNEAIFRAANERLRERLSQLEVNGRIPFVCECGDAECLQTVELSAEVYEEVRDSGREHFFLLAGHEDASTEKVVKRSNGYVITEKYESPT